MKRMILEALVMAMMAVMGVPVMAGPSLYKLTSNEAAEKGATHAVKFTYKDFSTSTGTNGAAYTNTTAFPVLAKQGVECVAMVLVTPFEYTTTNGLSSVAVVVGDGTDIDRYLTSTEVCVNGTEVFLKYGNTAWNSGSATNVTFAYGSKVYTSDDTVDFIFTPTGTEWSLSQCDKGEVWFYFKILDAARKP